MLLYLQIYQIALDNYIKQSQRTHYSLANDPKSPIYSFGWFSKIRHSRAEYAALVTLRDALNEASTEEDAKAVIVRHFQNPNHAWNNHSFNNYLLDELIKTTALVREQDFWQTFDKKPMVYYKGVLFRGIFDAPQQAFSKGLLEKNHSYALQDYLKDMNGAIGISTSTDFDIAESYALPNLALRRESLEVWHSSYIYVINYQGDSGIHLSATLKLHQRSFAAALSNRKKEVNIIEKIPPDDIVGAFYVDRSDTIIWHANPNYKGEDSFLQTSIPKKYLTAIIDAHHPEISQGPSKLTMRS